MRQPGPAVGRKKPHRFRVTRLWPSIYCSSLFSGLYFLIKKNFRAGVISRVVRTLTYKLMSLGSFPKSANNKDSDNNITDLLRYTSAPLLRMS
jgi:hypothetical protein